MKTTAIFNCTYGCNDNCIFCFNQKSLRKIPELSLEAIKANYFYLSQKYDLDGIIISGGEPSVHSQFWEIMDFFYNQIDPKIRPSLNTNSLVFADTKESERLLALLQKSSFPRKQLALSFSSVSSLDQPSEIEKRKILGFKKAFQAGLLSKTQIYVVVTITKQNYQILPEIADLILNQINQGGNSDKVIIQLRGLYLGSKGLNKEQEKACLPSSLEVFYTYVVSFIQKIIKNKSLNLNLYNLPLCLFQKDVDLNSLIQNKAYNPLKAHQRVMVNFNEQLSRANLSIDRGSPDLLECQNCLIQAKCNRIQPEYLQKGIIEEIIPFKKVLS